MIAVLAGGVGAARFLQGLVRVVDPADITVIVNTGDDTNLHGLHISPDLDTVTYTLAGASNSETGWGLAGESFRAMSALGRYGGATWFNLGDLDLGTHLFRTGQLRAGATLSEVTAAITAAWGIELRILPMSDDPVRTTVELSTGEVVEFQEYFVRLRHEVEIASIELRGIETARPAPGVLEALEEAEAIVLAPSNPVVSIGPILAVPGVRGVLERRRSAVVAISPIVAGEALKGPAARMLRELGHEQSALGVARLLSPVIGGFVLDEADADLAPGVESLGLSVRVEDTIMRDEVVTERLARAALGIAGTPSLSGGR
jgi:LPPG:FO 2-phospho-L-lactate transferase